MQKDRAMYERLVELMRFFNLIDVDIKLVSQLKAPFKGQDRGGRVPMLEFKETMRSVFQHFR